MSIFLRSLFGKSGVAGLCLLCLFVCAGAQAQQVTNANFEDWSAAAFNGEAQPKGWNASNVEQVGMKFNFAHKETGRNGGYCLMVQDQEVGAMGITETSPGYFSIGQPWAYLPSITAINQATAGTYGGTAWTYRPDSMSVWIKRTGSNTDKEDFYLLYYAWNGQTRGDKFKGKNGSCTSVTYYDEESDVRQALNGNECGTTVKATQVCEGMWRERNTYGEWTNIRVPIYYINNTVPTTMNIIFSASNYPNFRANSGLYKGNSLYVDDVQLIYSSAIQKLFVDDKEWKGFDPASSAVQVYPLGESATSIPEIAAMRGAGSITNAKGTTVSFPGRTLSGSEISIVKGDLQSTPTTITVRAEDGSSTRVYKIQFTKAASSNTKLAGISYVLGGDTTPISGFSPTKYTYTVALPYGTTTAPLITADGQEEKQTITITQPQSLSDAAVITVRAANGTSTATYTLNFTIAPLADNTLKDILVNGKSVPGFNPAQTTYKVSLPVGTNQLPTVVGVSAYPAGEQTITYTLPTLENLNGGSAQIRVTTPGNPTAKTYKLNFKLEASSYSYLQNLQVLGDQILKVNPARLNDSTAIAFEPDQFTYYVNLKMGTETLPQIVYTPGDEYQTITKTDGGIDGTTRITVLAGNRSDQSVYKIVFNTEKSEISTLAGIKIGGVLLDNFSPDQTRYDYLLPIGTAELPAIEPVPGDEFQKVTVTSSGVNGTTRITVTAGNGSTTIYLINFSVDSYTDNTLQMIYIGGEPLAGFAPEQNEYTYLLPQGTTELPDITVTKQDENLQTVTVRSGGVNGDYRITVRPLNDASRTYVIHFRVATSSNTALAMLYIDNVALEGFDPAVTHYTYSLPEGVSAIPAVTYLKAEAAQRVLSVLEDTTQLITVTAESGDKREYRIDFHISLSANAFLEMIYLDGDSLEGFAPEQLNYTYQLTSAVCPAVTVAKAAGQQVTVTTPVGAGKAVILVAPEQGAAQTYTITFLPVAAATVHLEGIALDGTPLAAFEPSQTHYELTYSRTLPEVTWQADPALSTALLWRGSTAYIQVADTAGNKAMYDLVFTRLYTNNAQLAAITADGVALPGFLPTQYRYAFDLAAGSTYPVLGYERADSLQTVVFGQSGEGRWRWVVTAENGDTATYSVTYTVARYTDATPADIRLIGLPGGQSLPYQPDTFTYSGLVLDEGAALPDIEVIAKPGQTVFSYNCSDTVQQVLVKAESGAQQTYTIRYTRVQSNNALLAAIRIDGVALTGFEPDRYVYTFTLPQGTTTMPNVFPVGQLDNQTITTYMGRTNDTTRIHVVAQDGVSTADYAVFFPVTKCTNTRLGSLSINGEPRDVNTTEYVLDVPYGTVYPYDVTYTKAEKEQLVDYEEAPLSGVTRIIVTDETGDQRIYSIRYNVAQPQGENIVKKVHYSYVNASNATQTGSLVPVAGENIVELPYGSKSFSVTGVEKNYDKQSVVFYNGGIRRGATIIAAANRDGAADVTYTIRPTMPEFETAGKLKDLKFKGVTIPNFRPDVYNYVVNVTAEPTTANFTATAYDGKSVTKTSNSTKKQMTFKVSGGETYSVCWYYTNYDKLFDFSGDWVSVAQGVGYKPSAAWKVPADYDDGYTWNLGTLVNLTYTTGKEVTPGGTNGVVLSTLRGAPMNGSVPGMMTLGGMTLSLTSNGNSTSSVTKNASVGTEFKNTPEALTFNVKPLSTSNITNWKLWLTLSDGSNYKESNYTGDFSALNKWATVSVPITLPTNAVSKFNIMLSSCDQENAKQYGGGTIYESSVMYDQIHFTYNSELTAATVDGSAATKNGKTFTKTVGSDYIGVPALKFTGKVHDQMQTIEWLNNGEWLNGELKAKVTNYGENSLDTTVYTVVLKRTAVTSTGYTIDFGAYTTTESGDTTYVNLPFGTKAMPDVTITPNSIHQQFAVTKSGNSVQVTVTPESGAAKTTVYVFRETKSDDVELEEYSLEDGKGNTVSYETTDAQHFIYQVSAAEMPVITYSRKEGQCVRLHYTKDEAAMTVTAEDGTTQRTYTFHRVDPTVVTSGRITEFAVGTAVLQDFGDSLYTYEAERPEGVVSYTLAYPTDSVVFIQRSTQMEWLVYGGTDHAYTYTYPVTKSQNALLADLTIDGVPYADFAPEMYDYTGSPIYSDTTVRLHILPAEHTQRIQTTQEADSLGVTYTAVVTAEDGVATRTYKFAVTRPKSDNNALAAILVDGVPVAGFHPDTLDYTVTLPSPAVKREQPQMPSISYVAGQKAQQILVETGLVNGDSALISVIAEQGGAPREYSVKVVAEPSHNTALTGIIVNGEALTDFEAGRHYYSKEVYDEEVEIIATSDDRFQTVTVTRKGTTYILEVTAEDKVSTSTYNVATFVQSLSNDATLSNILLDGDEFSKYMRDLNPSLAFDPLQHTYTINLPSGTTVLPEITAQLKMEGQQVNLSKNGMEVVIRVTAVDGSVNEYTLSFETPKSKNANLSMIFLNGDSLPGFRPDVYFYQVELPLGVHTMPEVAGQKGEVHQTVYDAEMDSVAMQATIRVKPEDPYITTLNSYTVVFRITQSAADTLQMIYADGDSLKGFAPHVFFYADSLPVGTTAFPELSWEEADAWQTVRQDTLQSVPGSSLIRRIVVTAENGHSNSYMISYTIRQSDVDTLSAIFVDKRQLENFDAHQTEYFYTLTAAQATSLNGALPAIDYIAGDEYQTVFVSQAPDSLSGKSLGYKSLVTVTAATGATRTYTIHYPVEKSTEANLNMIMVGGMPLSGFYSEVYIYRPEVEWGSKLPVVTVVKKEEAQTYEIYLQGEDTVLVDVTAEDGISRQLYTLAFSRVLSANARLANITIAGHREFLFLPDEPDYTIILPFGEDTVPAIEITLQDSLQTIPAGLVRDTLPNGDVQVFINVVAPNGEDEQMYSLTFHFTKNSDARLMGIYVHDKPLEGFSRSQYEYDYYHPYGTDSAAFYTAEDVRVELSDSLATCIVTVAGDGTLYIRVIAQDGTTENTYTIRQLIAPDTDNLLAAILLDGDTLPGFDAGQTFYTYYLFEGVQPPMVEAIARSENADVSIRDASAGDTCMIICTAADGSSLRYYIHFAISTINEALTPTANDVLLKRVPGTANLLAATIRKDVSIALYDQNGRLAFYHSVPVADPNEAEVVNDPNTVERLNDVAPSSGLVIPIIPGQIYQYVFFVSDKTKLKSGTLIALP